ncbi:MAG: TolC family protein [Planctomycetes bacterium]|nr:TolC family protein [Planctomycetota bacterium]
MPFNTPSQRLILLAWWTACLFPLAGCQSIRPAETVYRAHNVEQGHRAEKPQFLPIIEAKPIAPKPIPISLDTVLAMASDQNGQIRIARLKLDDASREHQSAARHWLPDLSVGIAAYRHDGGIQDFEGNLLRTRYGSALAGLEFTGKYDWKEHLYRRVEAERRVWQQKGELSRLASETLLDATSTYVGLLAARSGIAISLEMEIRLKDLLDQSKKLAKLDPGLQIEVSGIEREMMAQTVLTVKLREAHKAATAKLAYLLGLDPCCQFLVADGKLVPINIIDPNQPIQRLVDQALTRGPGVRELEGLLHAVETARNANYGITHWMPSVEVNLVEGALGASPASRSYDWSNRLDVGVRLRYNLTDIAFSKHKRRQADSNIEQVQLGVQDLRAKLALGVQEARDAIHSGLEQVSLAERHIRFAEDSHKLSDTRFREGIKGRSATEVLVALRALGGARLEYLQAVRELNRAQLRLFILVGSTEAECSR